MEAYNSFQKPMVALVVALSSAFLHGLPVLAQSSVVTYAGGNACDEVDPLETSLYSPSRVAIGPDDNVYISDTENHRIRKVDFATNIVSTIVGDGVPRYAGDEGPAVVASLFHPTDLAFDDSGNLYISDSYNNRIRMVDSDGIIHTIAGNGLKDNVGDPSNVGDGGFAVDAFLSTPRGLAVFGDGRLLITDTFHHRVRTVDLNGQIDTFAGTGAQGYSGDGGLAVDAELNGPRDITYDNSGVIYIADALNNVIRRVDASGIITTFAGNGVQGFDGDGGPATGATMYHPRGVAIAPNGEIYISDTENSLVRKVDGNGIITTVAGGIRGFSGDGGPAVLAELNYVYGLVFDGFGNYFVADQGNKRIRMVDPLGDINTVVGTGGGCFVDDVSATQGALNAPSYITRDRTGNVFVGDTGNNRIRRIDIVTKRITTIAGNGQNGFSGDGGPAINAALNKPTGVAIGRGNVYFADSLNHRIRRIAPNGVITTVAGTGVEGFSGDGGLATSARLNFPGGLYFRASTNTLYFADSANSRIRRIDLANGTIATVAGNGQFVYNGDGIPATSAALNFPRDVTGDSNGNLYIADTNNNRIRMVNPNGTISTIAGTGVMGYFGHNIPAVDAILASPAGIMYRMGEVYVSDTTNKVVRRIDQNGIIFRVAGTPNPFNDGFNGDGLDPLATLLDYPVGLAFVENNLLVCTTYASRIRAIVNTQP